MTQWLRQVGRRRGPTGAIRLAVEDYDASPRYCRHGIWIGTRTDSAETVEYACPAGSPSPDFPHGTMLLAAESAGSAGSAVLLYPDVASNGDGSEPPPGTVRPVPGCPGVTCAVTRSGEEYRILFTIAEGTDPVELIVVALPSGRDCSELEPTALSLAGCVFEWSADDLARERRCKDLRRHQYVRYPLFGRPTPPEPVENWLDALRGDDVRTVHRLAEVLGTESAEPALRDAAMSQLLGMYLTSARTVPGGADISAGHRTDAAPEPAALP